LSNSSDKYLEKPINLLEHFDMFRKTLIEHLALFQPKKLEHFEPFPSIQALPEKVESAQTQKSPRSAQTRHLRIPTAPVLH
jgi:hypothetical protein